MNITKQITELEKEIEESRIPEKSELLTLSGQFAEEKLIILKEVERGLDDAKKNIRYSTKILKLQVPFIWEEIDRIFFSEEGAKE